MAKAAPARASVQLRKQKAVEAVERLGASLYEAIVIEGQQTTTVGGKQIIDIGANQAVTVAGNQTITIGGDLEVNRHRLQALLAHIGASSLPERRSWVEARHVGAIAPAGGCTQPGQKIGVPYSADYYFFIAR